MPFREMPKDFALHATDSLESLRRRYRAGSNVIRRWKDLCGVQKKYKRPVIRINEDGEELYFANPKEAAEGLFATMTNIYCALRDGRSAYGYRWRYATDEEIDENEEDNYGFD